MVRVSFHRGKCIGCNGCVEVDPNRWRISKKDGRCNLIEGKGKKGIYRTLVNEDEYPLLVQVAANCPVKIIRIERI